MKFFKSNKSNKSNKLNKSKSNENDNNLVISKIITLGKSRDHRFHLRFLRDGRGILNIDAKHIIFLNETARLYFYLFISGHSMRKIQRTFMNTFRGITKQQVASDWKDIMKKITQIIEGENLCPVHDIGLIPKPAYEDVGFPLRVDLAITYSCNNLCPHCYVPKDILNNFPDELDLDKMKCLMDKLWDLGVPHIALTGGEATTRRDFIDLIEYGQNKGFVMGIITNGRLFSDEELVKTSIQKGLDYVQITIESHDAEIHDKMQGVKGAFKETVQAIKNFMNKDIFVLTNTTICRENLSDIDKTIKFLYDLGIRAFAMNGLIYSGRGAELQKEKQNFLLESELEGVIDKIYSYADSLDMRFIWYTPTQYCVFNPIEMGLGPKHCSAANMSISIQPNGDVIPCQSYFQAVGNILTDSWDEIWNSDLFKSIRKHDFVEEKCKKCELLEICGGGCPLYIKEKSVIPSHMSHL
ncbi:MAG: radical SAM protein [Candidatus Lokiarchaeota archaeon]|nr:radical SAM protein [Candidatus Lokiarchaeota archaeon]